MPDYLCWHLSTSPYLIFADQIIFSGIQVRHLPTLDQIIISDEIIFTDQIIFADIQARSLSAGHLPTLDQSIFADQIIFTDQIIFSDQIISADI